MFDLGTSFLASVERDPTVDAIVDRERRLTYGAWYAEISSVAAHLKRLGLGKGDHLVSALQNSLDAATLHWACQFLGIIITPINWRATPDEIDFALQNAEGVALIHDHSSAASARQAKAGGRLPRIIVDDTPQGSEIAFADMRNDSAPDAQPEAAADDWSLMLYTSGTTSAPKGVPRRHRAERAAAIAHVAQNLYPTGERTLGVMPLYHTMGVRSLLAMSLINGCFVCLPRFDVQDALDRVRKERISSLYLVPTLYHDILAHPACVDADLDTVKRLGFAGAAMTDGLLQRVQKRFQPELFVNHYGSSEIYTFTIDQKAVLKPGSAGKAGLNQIIRVVPLDAEDGETVCPPMEEGQIIAHLSGDESFEGYWRRADADEKGLKNGWYFTGDSGYFDSDGDLFVTGRVDDMIITGGENVSPAEIESCLSLHPAVSECAVVGLPDERWGKAVTAFIKRTAPVTEDDLDAHCRTSDLANFKRPRAYHFVEDIPKSPVGKLLRRFLVAGEWTPEKQEPQNMSTEGIENETFDGFRVEVDAENERGDIVLCRPPMNVIMMEQRPEMRRAFEALDRDDRVRVIVLRAEGEHFSSGGYIMGFLEASPEHVSHLADNMAAPWRCAKPVVVANQGYTFGVGFEVSLSCDFRICAESCQYSLPEQRLGQIPGSGGSARLQAIIGIQRTKDVVMRSKRISGKQAVEWGIASECVPDDKLEEATAKLVKELRGFAPLAQRTAKKLINDSENATVATGIELEGHAYSRLRQSDDFAEGVKAFHEKRKPDFKGS